MLLIIKPTRCTNFSKFIFGIKLYMFRTIPVSIIRSFSLYTQQWYMSYSLRAVPSWSYSQAVSKPLWHIPLLCVQWKTPDDGQRNCTKHVEFYSKNKFEKLVHLVGFIIRIYHWCTVTWTSNAFYWLTLHNCVTTHGTKHTHIITFSQYSYKPHMSVSITIPQLQFVICIRLILHRTETTQPYVYMYVTVHTV